MKLQLKLALYNTLTKFAIILVTGGLILFSLENVSYNHISHRLEDKKDELIRHLSSKEINTILKKQNEFTDYNLLREEYIVLKPVAYLPSLVPVESFSTEARAIEQSKETYRILTYKFNFNNTTYLLEIGETIDAAEELQETIRGFTLLMIVVAVTLTLLLDLTFTKYLMNPLYQIIDRKLIKAKDPLNFDYSEIKTTTHDFKLLDSSISLMMKKISDMFILEKQFIANVSHELLTPISIISSRLENILLQEKLAEESENKIYASLKTLNRLKSIINSLLLISKVENNQFNKGDIVEIGNLIDEVYAELEDRMEDKGIVWQNNTARQFSIIGNHTLMHTLLFNVINNAIKYNNTGGSLIISDTNHDEQYTLEITDTGIGMNNAEIKKAFERFEKSEVEEKESFGLGLAIVKSIAAFHEITIGITSKKDEGTAFRLNFTKQG